MKKILLIWSPRVLAIFYTVLISFFSMGPAESIYIILARLTPVFALILITLIAWFKPKIGGIAFIILSFAFLFIFHTYRDPDLFLVLHTPIILIGILFWRSAKMRECAFMNFINRLFKK